MEFISIVHCNKTVVDYVPKFTKSVETKLRLFSNKRYKKSKFFYSPTDAQVNCLKNNFKIYIEIDIKTAPTCFGAITIIREHIIRAY
jgi:hypothetical protein